MPLTRRAALSALASPFGPPFGAQSKLLPDGFWPAMLTPFKADRSIDWNGLDALTEWYLANGAVGLFSCCASSEVNSLTVDERVEVARRVVQRAGRTPVVAAGLPSRELGVARPFIDRMMETGVDAFVIITNEMADKQENDAIWKQRMEELMAATMGTRLGFYERPGPYKRLLSNEIMRWAGQSGRFCFMKDVSLKTEVIRARVAAVQATPLKIFNAHAAIMLDAVLAGGHGFCGVCGNAYPAVVSAVLKQKSDRLQEFVRANEPTVARKYPASAKVMARLAGVPIEPVCRKRDIKLTDEELERLKALRAAADQAAPPRA